ncbi:uncharacterized protein LOC131324362 [Rhododendron vialii]|uniref:uncharacterized protein LOC131324362 n=1 Tax=Rhododendron vialii TaxID=182163 RepID=UPI00265E7809|nr:uncharacterized protein LOC131324362 [Rhododendron vialii]
MRHMYANFRILFKGKDLKDLMWGVACAYTVLEFELKMNQLLQLNPEAHEWLLKEPPQHWARCFFSPMPKCNRLDNNLSESFNKSIMEARDKPILTMLEMIRRQLMSRFQERFHFIQKFSGLICPSIQKKLEKKKAKARDCDVLYAGGTIFEVTTYFKTYVVDIGRHSCTCRQWDLTGIPCKHGIAAIWIDKREPEEFVHQCFHISTFINTYNDMINPIPDQSLWVHTNSDPIMPPILRKQSGRPRKSRRKAADEPKYPERIRKHYESLRCGNCSEFGHNTRTCKAPKKPTQVGTVTTSTGRGRGASNGRGKRGRGKSTHIGRGRGSSTGRGRAAITGRGRAVTAVGRGIGLPLPPSTTAGPPPASIGRSRALTVVGRGIGLPPPPPAMHPHQVI